MNFEEGQLIKNAEGILVKRDNKNPMGLSSECIKDKMKQALVEKLKRSATQFKSKSILGKLATIKKEAKEGGEAENSLHRSESNVIGGNSFLKSRLKRK